MVVVNDYKLFWTMTRWRFVCVKAVLHFGVLICFISIVPSRTTFLFAKLPLITLLSPTSLILATSILMKCLICIEGAFVRVIVCVLVFMLFHPALRFTAAYKDISDTEHTTAQFITILKWMIPLLAFMFDVYLSTPRGLTVTS